jgi:hypothetical protein
MKIHHIIAQLIPEEQVNVPKTTLNESSASTGLQIFFGIAAAVAVLVIAVSALKMTISRGNADEVKKARDAILYASIGLAITLSGFVIVTFVVEQI